VSGVDYNNNSEENFNGYSAQSDYRQRDYVVIIPVQEALDLKLVCDALLSAVRQACLSGPKHVILEIDSPGGQAQYIERLCDLIICIDNCHISAYLCGGRHRGALGTSAAMALACDEIYMAPETTIGAATLVIAEPISGPPDSNSANDKLSIAWQEYLASLAHRRGRPGLLAKAMVDKEIVVIEVIRNGTPLFIEPQESEPDDVFLKNWSTKGSLLTLTAAEARQCLIAEAIVADRAALLRKLSLEDAEVIVKDDVEQAVRTFRKSRLKYERLRRQLDAQIKKLEMTLDLPEAMTLLKEVIENYKSMLLIAKRYPDLYLDVTLIEEQLSSAEMYYEKAKDKHRQIDVNSPQNGKPVK
jgi:hypothetical protein